MKIQLKKYMKTIKDFAYSFLAYALPTVVLQFAVQPLIASMADSNENGLFLSLYNAIKLCVSVLVVSMANARLLDKKECIADNNYDKGYNVLFLLVSALAAAVMVGFSLFYRGTACTVWDYVRLLAVVILLCAHDFYSIAFRVDINYKNILIDNGLIVVGYGLGLLLFWKFGHWEYIFICGYTMGLAFVLCKTRIWRAGLSFKTIKRIVPKYTQLCASSGLNNATVYCDRLLIYPMIGGYAVSVYNAAAVVSKVISVVVAPIRNVLLSYIVDKDRMSVNKKQLRKLLLILVAAAVVLYCGFYLASAVLCRLLYPQYYADALRYVPIILLAMILDTGSSVLNVALLRFSKASLQILISSVKIGIYLASVFLLTGQCNMELLGFCFAILLADGAKFILVVYHFIKNLNVKNTNSEGIENV